MIAGENTLPGLAYQLVKKSKCGQFTIWLPVGSPLFPGRGEILPFGMLKPVPGNAMPLQIDPAPYLGLQLD